MKRNLFLYASLLVLTILMYSPQRLLAQMAGVNHMHMSHSDPVHKHVYLQMMDTMMVSMERATGDRTVETGFVRQMIPHHQGAIAMARYEISHGHSFEMIQLAKSILAEQTSELQQMNLSLRQQPKAETPVTAGFGEAMNKSMIMMMKNLPDNDKLTDVDRSFAAVMLPHHQAAVDMARAVLQFGHNPQTLAFAQLLISNEQVEIEQMSTYIH